MFPSWISMKGGRESNEILLILAKTVTGNDLHILPDTHTEKHLSFNI